ncbi:GNAT family N-acetyltransferase [Xanthobacteraceae bacterium Astr-EGSB]|uniref:GNAT family N-acetyltransferase n=1 Tax=Astrobacterium formosum TaxID=3069710 RepID=UPI0027B13630|nr:GNAT family N-acetyltransferase [Xanthobacteraceae bacterium Astr-EGSB]
MAEIRDNSALSRFELDAEGGTALAYYRLDEGTITFTHTETPPALRGRGIASRLIDAALASAQARGLRIVPLCSFVAARMARDTGENEVSA